MSIRAFDLENIPYDQLVSLIEGIDDEQAENSDIGGDSEPEDDRPLNVISRTLAAGGDFHRDIMDTPPHQSPAPVVGDDSPKPISPVPSPAVPTQQGGRGRVRTRSPVSAQGRGRYRTRGPRRACGRGATGSMDVFPSNSTGGSDLEEEIPFNVVTRLNEGLEHDVVDSFMEEESESSHGSSNLISPVPTPTPTQQSGRGRVRTRVPVRARGVTRGRRQGGSVPNPYRFQKIFRTPQEYKNYRFRAYHGINEEVDISSPLQIFMMFFTNILLQHIVTQSNIYSNNTLNLAVDELKAFLGMLIVMGFHQVPSIRLYWSSNSNFHFPRIANLMSLKRFLKILRFLHLNDNSTMKPRGDPQYDRLHKIRPMLSMLSESFKNAFSPSRYLSVDESMIPFKGRSMLKQYMPLKPVKRGFKVWVLCCALTGYMVSMDIYEGKDSTTTADFGLGEKVVMRLTQTFVGLGFCIYFDRFFNSVSLLTKLLQKNIFACGTLMASRKYFPFDKLRDDRELATGDFDSVMDESISITKWKDRGKKCVLIASNMHNPASITSVTRTNKVGWKEEVKCPQSVADYNRYMGGVDRFDQLLAAYSVSWKSRRWWMKIFYYLLDAAVVNSYIIYRETAKQVCPRSKVLSHLMFRSFLANELISDYKSRKRNSIAASEVQFKADQCHFPEKTTCKRCAYCSTKSKPVRSRVGCDICKVSLCVSCFKSFHNNGCKKRETS